MIRYREEYQEMKKREKRRIMNYKVLKNIKEPEPKLR